MLDFPFFWCYTSSSSRNCVGSFFKNMSRIYVSPFPLPPLASATTISRSSPCLPLWLDLLKPAHCPLATLISFLFQHTNICLTSGTLHFFFFLSGSTHGGLQYPSNLGEVFPNYPDSCSSHCPGTLCDIIPLYFYHSTDHNLKVLYVCLHLW